MAGPIDRLRTKLGRFAEPEALLQRVRALVGQARPAKGPAGVTRTPADAVAELKRIAAQSVVVYGDAALRDELQAASGARCTWVSHRAADLQRGALDLRRALDGADAIVVGGRDLKTAYVHVLRTLVGRADVPRVLWVGDGFEFCFSTLPVPAAATRADIYLHNHFDAYFALRDPLLLSIRASDGTSAHEEQRIVAPHETIRLSIDELLPERAGASFVELYTSHPVLTRGRHHRWRLCADVYWGDSFTTLHGAHDEGPDRPSHSRISTTLVGDGELVVTVPNYELATPGSPVTKHELGAKTKLDRSEARPLEEVRYRGAAGTRGHFGYEYVGHGTSFYYGMRSIGGRQVLFGNHESTLALEPAKETLSADRRAVLDGIESCDLLLLPHALPVLDGPVELGFSFASATPTIDQYVVRAFDRDGRRLGQAQLRDPFDGPLFTGDIVARLGMPQSALLVIAPDWRALGGDPAKFNMAGELVARDRQSGDFDVTEFQSCWRNLGMLVDEFPHWIAPPNALISRTRLVGRVVCGGAMHTGLVMVHASGNANLAGDAHAEVHVIDPRGRAHVREVTLPAFTHRLVWLDELFADLPALLPEGFGTVMILSPDRDLNVQLLTHDRSAKAVSLQHLWGY